MGLINEVDMVCLSPVGYSYPTGDKHTISTSLIKPIFSVLAHAEKQFFSKLVFECLFCFLFDLMGLNVGHSVGRLFRWLFAGTVNVGNSVCRLFR